jgi:hypothetical protein
MDWERDEENEQMPDRRTLAFHEAGHAVAAYVLAGCLGQDLLSVSINPIIGPEGLDLGRVTKSEVQEEKRGLVYYGPTDRDGPEEHRWRRRHFQAQVVGICMGVLAEKMSGEGGRGRYSGKDLDLLFFNMSSIHPRFVKGDDLDDGNFTPRGLRYFSLLERVASDLTDAHWIEVSAVAAALIAGSGELSGDQVRDICEGCKSGEPRGRKYSPLYY